MAFIRSISGIRATENDGLVLTKLSEYIISFCNLYGQNGIIFGRDGRQTGKWIEKLIESTCESLNVKYKNIGIAPTPTIMLIVEKFGFGGGISITASHNPSQWNGLKFINQDGVFLNQIENNQLWDLVDNKTYSFEYLPKMKTNHKNYNEVVKVLDDNNFNALEYHLNEILSLPIIKSNFEEMCKYFKENNFKVVVDAVNSSGSIIVPKLLETFGIEVIRLFCDDTQNFPHTPEPILENLTELIDNVKETNSNLGIAVDPDADRLVIIAENGVAIGEENTIVLSALSLLEYLNLSTNLPINIVVNSSTTSMVEKVADKYDAKVFRSSVGEINVVEEMKKVNAVIGGEGSGGVILPELHYSRDSVVGVALILYLLYSQKSNLLTIIDKIGSSFMLKDKIAFEGDLEIILPKIQDEFQNDKIIMGDGIKIYLSDYEWVQLRKSNTEPIVRIIAESNFEEVSKNLLNRVKSIFIKNVK